VSINAFIPDSYISDSRQKIESYHRIAAVSNPAEAGDLEEELVDRFGPLPGPVANLLVVARTRAAAGRLGVSSVSKDPAGGLLVRFERPSPEVRGALESLSGGYPGASVRSSPRAMLLLYRPGRRPSLGDVKKGNSRGNVELLHGLLDLLVHVSRRIGQPTDAGRSLERRGH